MLNESIDMNKTELKKFIQDIFDDEFKKEKNKNKPLTEKEIKSMVREMIKNHYKTLWQKSNLFLTGLT